MQKLNSRRSSKAPCELDERQQELKSRFEDLEKRTLLPADKVQAKQAEIQKDAMKLQQTMMWHQQSLAQEEKAATGKIPVKMQGIIKRIADEGKFTLVLDRAAVIHGMGHLDLTNELIRRYNDAGRWQKGGKKSAKKKSKK